MVDERLATGATADQETRRRKNPFPRLRRVWARPRIALPVMVILVAAVALGGWALSRPAGSTGPSYRDIPAVKTTMSQTLSSTGTIEPATTDTLSFSASGQVTAVNATAGQRVTQGQALATMDSPSLQAQVAQAKASLAGAQSQLSQDQAGRASSAQLAADQASVNAAQSQVDSADTALSGATLTAPIDGIVGTVGLTAGQQLSGGSGGGGSDSASGGDDSGGGSGGGGSDSGSGGDGSGSGSSGSSTSSIVVISANDVIDANVDATVVGRLKPGDQAVITTEGAAGPVTGTVASIGLTANTSSGVATFPVVINVTGTPPGLYAGASANVVIIYKQLTGVLAVPAAAVGVSGGKTVVHTIVGGHQVTRDVTTGLTAGGLTQITHGLTAGQQVVVAIPHVGTSSGGTSNPGGGPGVVILPGGVRQFRVSNAVPVGGPGG
jgi:membrane fusion protein, macrolide-specific efflux system